MKRTFETLEDINTLNTVLKHAISDLDQKIEACQEIEIAGEKLKNLNRDLCTKLNKYDATSILTKRTNGKAVKNRTQVEQEVQDLLLSIGFGKIKNGSSLYMGSFEQNKKGPHFKIYTMQGIINVFLHVQTVNGGSPALASYELDKMAKSNLECVLLYITDLKDAIESIKNDVLSFDKAPIVFHNMSDFEMYMLLKCD